MSRRKLAVLLVWTVPSVLFLAIAASVYVGFRIAPPDRLDEAERTHALATLRAALNGTPLVASGIEQASTGPVVVNVWSNGKAIVRVQATGPTIGAAIDDAATQLRAAPAVTRLEATLRQAARIQVDVTVGRAPLGHGHWLFDRLTLPYLNDLLPLNPGIDGIGVDVEGKPSLLLPHELVAAKVLASKRPSQAMADFAIGLNIQRIRTLLAKIAGDQRAGERERWYRFRTDTFVERPPATRTQPPLALTRGTPPAPKLDAAALRSAALSGGRYLVAHLQQNGRYIYEHDLASGAQTSPKSTSYSMPRHAGTTYFLAELYRITKEEWLREPIERAFAHLAELMANGKCATTLPDGTVFDCVMDRHEKQAHLGSTALTVVALAEYQRATGSATYLPTATKLANFLRWMQRPDGSFRHLYDPVKQRADDATQMLYYSGEAALALARMHVITGDPRYADAARRALEWLVDWYDFFLGGFFYGEDHWTCIAAEAAYPAVTSEKLVDFCHGYGTFLRDQQGEATGGDEDDYAGAYLVTPFVAPMNTPAGSRSEAMISAYLLGKHHGRPDPDVREQVRAALAYVLGQVVTPDTDFWVVGQGIGGMPGSPVDRTVRIDYVQHVGSAFIRTSEWIDGG